MKKETLDKESIEKEVLENVTFQKEASQNKTWKDDNERFICFMDIMGFKDMVYSNSHEFVKKKLISLASLREFILKETKAIKKGEKFPEYKDCEIEVILFSDSLILITNDASENDFMLLSYAIRKIMLEAFKKSIPIKGAVSLGHMTANFEKSIFFGKPLIDAYLLQEELNYYGVVCDHHVETFFVDNNLEGKDEDLHTFVKTPLKRGSIMHLNIKLHPYLTLEHYKTLYKTVSGNPRIYVDNTISMFEAMSKM